MSLRVYLVIHLNYQHEYKSCDIFVNTMQKPKKMIKAGFSICSFCNQENHNQGIHQVFGGFSLYLTGAFLSL